MRKLKPIMPVKRTRYRAGPGRPIEAVTLQGIGRDQFDANREVLTGSVQNMKASAGEERFAYALDRYEKVRGYQFRMTLGAARNMPGFNELDFLVEVSDGMYRAVEIDSVFSHRDKQYKDRLHDAILLQELNYLSLFPTVLHVDIDEELADQDMANRTVRRLF